MIELIKAAGYDVYVATCNNPMWCYYTNGSEVGYAQWGFHPSVSTVHKPHSQVGTGFHVADDIAPGTLKEGLAFAPAWASRSDRSSVHKYKSWEDFRSNHWAPASLCKV
jgi:hypothetical protein